MSQRSCYSRTSFVSLMLVMPPFLLAQQPLPGPPASRHKPPSRTAAALARMSQAQREHAKLFDSISKSSTTQLLDEKSSVDVSVDFAGGPPIKTTNEILTTLACGADEVFVGHVVSVVVFPTESGTFLFSEYEVQPREVLGGRAASITPTAFVTIVRPGGTTIVDGTRVSATINTHPPLEEHQQYLFFGQRAPGNALTTVASGVFRLSGAQLHPVHPVTAKDAPGGPLTLHIDAVRRFLAGHKCQ